MPSTGATSPSPSGALSKLRRKAGASNDSSNSLESSSNSDNPYADPALQPTDSGLGKLRDKFRRKSVDDRGGKRGSQDSGRRLSALVPNRRNKLRKVASSDLQQQSSLSSSTGNLAITGNRSDSSLGVGGSGHSSLLTDDNSENEM